MKAHSPQPRLFLGSSSEGRDVARHLQAEMGNVADFVRWDQSVFEPGGFTLDSLIATAAAVDFAVLIATPDDTTVSRGEEMPSARDNIVLEFGLFSGVLGRERTFLLPTGPLKLPTDVLGLTRLTYHPQPNPRAAVTAAALQVEERIRVLGPIARDAGPGVATPHAKLESELELLSVNAEAQGWTVRTNNRTTLRLRSPGGAVFTLSKERPETTRTNLRRFARQLRAAGLRVNSSILRPLEESPL